MCANSFADALHQVVWRQAQRWRRWQRRQFRRWGQMRWRLRRWWLKREGWVNRRQPHRRRGIHDDDRSGRRSSRRGAGIRRRTVVSRRGDHRRRRRYIDGRCNHRGRRRDVGGQCDHRRGGRCVVGRGRYRGRGRSWSGDWRGSDTRGHAHGARLVRVAEEGHAQCGAQADRGDQASGQHPLADEPRLAHGGRRVSRKVIAVLDKSGRIAVRGAIGRVTERARRPRGRHGALFAARCLGGRVHSWSCFGRSCMVFTCVSPLLVSKGPPQVLRLR